MGHAEIDRRRLLVTGAAAALIVAVRPHLVLAQAGAGPFSLPALPYPESALEPHVDAQTMGLHHGRHHKAYVDNVNRLLESHGELQRLSALELLRRLPEVPDAIRTGLRNNLGGHVNHTMFWSIMGPGKGGAPVGETAAAIERDFGGFDAFKQRFNAAGLGQFGSGWAFVTVEPGTGKLAVAAAPNQDTPLMEGRPVLMGNDVWEHAYYLKYQNRRADYLNAWWNVVDWAAVDRRYAAIRRGEAII
ncbi:superoxide dismutase [Arenibaculum pallidiluteum]|uniref:superoxide dismutase n=1 Tax=Arenibaculum pallidiluteum TaxID=2812559 RepID=UPI001A95CB02|nr:superoxide dismutase [Arenibaculum pallidiluteum]